MCLGSVVRLATGARRGLWARKALLEALESEASRARRAARATLACRAPRASVVALVTWAREEPPALRETRAWQAPMAFLGTKEIWVPVVRLDPKESPAVEGSWARRASRVPMAPAVSRASRALPALWASRGYKACLASPGNPESRGEKPASSTSGSCVEGCSVNKSRS